MRSMKLGTKIVLGFVILLLVALALGLMAVWQMSSVSGTAGRLSNEYVPEVTVANGLERSSLLTMYAIRGYGYSADKSFLDDGRRQLAAVDKSLGEAKALGAKYPGLVKLREEIGRAESRIKDYETLVGETERFLGIMDAARKKMGQAAQKYMKNSYDFLESQDKALENEIKAGAEPAKLIERYKKTSMCNDIIDLGNDTRIKAWMSQTEREPKGMLEAMKNFEAIDKKLDELKAITRQEVNLRQIEEVRAAGKEYKLAMQELLEAFVGNDKLTRKRAEVAEGVLTVAQDLAKVALTNTSNLSGQASSSLSTANTIMIIGLIVAVIAGILAALLITRSITGPLNRAIDGLNEGASQVTSASDQVSAASQELAEGSSEQAAAVEETSSSLEEMTSMTRQNADNATQANSLMDETRATVNRAAGSMKEMTKAMADISSSGREIGKIIKTIDEIAFQTNLLALNAAVEAARAGEAGAGFAVVADEVRNLAQRAAESAKNTAGLIEGTITQINRGTELVRTADEAFTEVATNAGKVGELVGEIAAASSEQAQGIDQINQAVAQMDKVTQKNAANAEETASASEELNAQAESMRDIVAELAVMVGGSMRISQPTRRAAGPKMKTAQAVPRLTAGPAKAKTGAKPVGKTGLANRAAPASAKVAKADDIIPMDDDFKDF